MTSSWASADSPVEPTDDRFAFIGKPFSPQALVAKVQEVLDGV